MKEALALAGGARRLSAREEELLGLLAGFPDGGSGGSDRELSFSDLVEAGASWPPSVDEDADLGAKAPRGDRPCPAAALSSPGSHEAAAAASKQQRQQAARHRAARRSGGGGSRGSCGGGGDGVLLNFYVPGLLTRSMTTPRPSRGPPSPGAVQGAPSSKPVAAAAANAGKASRRQTALGIGCWPALWGRGRRPAKACS